MGQAMNGEETTGDTFLSGYQIVAGLQIEPILWRLLKSFCKQQCQFSRNRAPAFNDMGNAHGRHANGTSEQRLREMKLFKKFGEVLAGMDRFKTIEDHAVKGVFEIAHDSSRSHEEFSPTIPAQWFHWSEQARLSNGHLDDEESGGYL